MPITPPADDPPVAPAADVTLDEFCMDLSRAGDIGVELLAGFHSDELRNARFKDSPDAFQARLEAFCGRPVARS